MITNISVLNSVKDNAADFFVDADGFLNITGCPKVKAKTAKVNTIAIVNPTPAVYTVTFGGVSNYTYNFRVTGYDASNNLITLPFSYTTAATGVTPTTVATAIASLISKSAIGAKFASVVGGATLVLTGTAINPLISFENYNSDTSIVISAVGSGTTLGVEAQGYGADLLVTYSGFINGSSIVPTNYYTQHEITLTPDVMFGGQAITEWGSTTYIVLVNASAVTGGVNNALGNISLINDASYGTVALLKAGYRATVTAVPIATTGAFTSTPFSGGINLSGGTTTFSTLGGQSGDYVLLASVANFAAIVFSKITGITSTTAAIGTTIVTQGAVECKYVAVRNIAN